MPLLLPIRIASPPCPDIRPTTPRKVRTTAMTHPLSPAALMNFLLARAQSTMRQRGHYTPPCWRVSWSFPRFLSSLFDYPHLSRPVQCLCGAVTRYSIQTTTTADLITAHSYAPMMGTFLWQSSCVCYCLLTRVFLYTVNTVKFSGHFIRHAMDGNFPNCGRHTTESSFPRSHVCPVRGFLSLISISSSSRLFQVGGPSMHL
jgi:hypothetical protein